jgi:hypothetical protein
MNTTLISNVDAGGAGLTLIIDLVVSILIIGLYLIVLIPCCTMFSSSKKHKLLTRILEEEQVKKGEVVATESTITTTTIEVNEKKNKWKYRFHALWYYCLDILMFLWHTTKTLVYWKARRKDLKYMTTTYGRDTAAYIYFEQQMIYCVLICSIIGLSVFLPLHLTGTVPDTSVSDSSNEYLQFNASAPLLVTSINMRIAEPYVLYTHIFVGILFMLLFAYFLIFRYLRHPIISELNYLSADDETLVQTKLSDYHLVKLNDWNYDRPLAFRMALVKMTVARTPDDFELQKDTVYLASGFCVAVKGCPSLMNQQAFIDIIYDAARNAGLDSHILKVVLVADLRKRVQMQNRLYNLIEELHAVLHQNSKFKNKNKRATVTLFLRRDLFPDNGEKFHFFKKVDAEEYYKRHIDALKRDIEKWDRVYIESHGSIKSDRSVGEAEIVDPTDEYYESEVKKIQIKPPRASGYGFIVFNTVQAARQFQKYYAGAGIQLKRINQQQRIKTIVSQLPWRRDTSKRTTALSDTTSYSDTSMEPYPVATDVGAIPVVSNTAKYEVLTYKPNIWHHIFHYYYSLFSLRVENVEYEPEDVEWFAVFQFGKYGVRNFIRRVFVQMLLLLIFIFINSPAAITSGIQSVITLDAISVSLKWVERLTGWLGTFLLYYIPSFIVFLVTVILPNILYYIAMWQKHRNHSTVQRSVFLIMFIYLVLGTLILPTLLLSTIDGFINYFNGKHSIEKAFAQIFLPASGSFFINFLIQKALLKNSLDILRPQNMFNYGVRRIKQWIRYRTPTQRLWLAEQTTLYIEWE